MSENREDEFCKAFSGLLVTSSSIQLLLKVFPCDEELKKALALTQKASRLLDEWCGQHFKEDCDEA